MGVAATPKYKEGIYWIHRERKEFGGSECFDDHAFYVGYNVANDFYSAIKIAYGVWGFGPRETSQLHSLQCQRKPLCHIISKLQSIIFDVEKTMATCKTSLPAHNF